MRKKTKKLLKPALLFSSTTTTQLPQEETETTHPQHLQEDLDKSTTKKLHDHKSFTLLAKQKNFLYNDEEMTKESESRPCAKSK
jgi:hypothetical protein